MGYAPRFPDWQRRLDLYIRTKQAQAFRWGLNDCCIFAGDCVLTLTGKDPVADFRGVYSDEQGARQALKIYGSGNLYKTLTDILGPPIKNVRLGQRGDVAMVRTPSGPAAAIVLGQKVALPTEKDGLAFQALEDAFAVWRI